MEDFMAFQNCPGIAEIGLQFVWQGQLCANVLHARKDTPWSSAELVALSDAAVGWISNDWNDAAISSASCVGVKSIDLSTELGAIGLPTTFEAVPGNLAATNVPTSATVAVSLRTAFRGRSFRGRVYHVGVSLAHITDSRLNATGQAVLSTVYNALVTRIAATAGGLCVLSRFHDHAKRATGVGFLVTSIAINTALDSQRRRLPERGS